MPAEPRASLAVVPIGNGAAREVEHVLAGLATWLVGSRVEAAATHTPADLQRIGQSASARYVLHGWIDSERDRTRMTLAVNETATGRELWSARFDSLPGERDTIRTAAVARIGQAIPALLLQRELDRSDLLPPRDVTPHDLALRAFVAIMQPRRNTPSVAASLLADAAGKAGPKASVHYAMVWWHVMGVRQGWAADLSAAGEAAAGLDRDDPAAMAMLAHMHSLLHRDHRVALALLDRVLIDAPQCGIAASLKALTLCWLGEAQAAVVAAEQADAMPALGPERAWRGEVAALARYGAEQYDSAVSCARASAAHHPGLAANLRVLAASLAVLGRLDQAQQAAHQVLAIDPRFRIGTWAERSMLPHPCRDTLAQRLRLAGLPG